MDFLPGAIFDVYVLFIIIIYYSYYYHYIINIYHCDVDVKYWNFKMMIVINILLYNKGNNKCWNIHCLISLEYSMVEKVKSINVLDFIRRLKNDEHRIWTRIDFVIHMMHENLIFWFVFLMFSCIWICEKYILFITNKIVVMSRAPGCEGLVP